VAVPKYAISGHTFDNPIRVQRSLLEDRLLTTIRERLLPDRSIKEFTARLRRRLQTRQRLQEAETELAQLPGPSAVVRVDDVIKHLPEAIARYRQMVSNLGDAPIDVELARQAVRGILDEITIVPRDGYSVARMELEVVQPIRASNRGSGGSIWQFPTQRPNPMTANQRIRGRIEPAHAVYVAPWSPVADQAPGKVDQQGVGTHAAKVPSRPGDRRCAFLLGSPRKRNPGTGPGYTDMLSDYWRAGALTL
jgi:hypothetical protein